MPRTAFEPPSDRVWRAFEPPSNRVWAPGGGEGDGSYLAFKGRFSLTSIPKSAGKGGRHTPMGGQNGLFLNEIMGPRTAQTPFKGPSNPLQRHFRPSSGLKRGRGRYSRSLQRGTRMTLMPGATVTQTPRGRVAVGVRKVGLARREALGLTATLSTTARTTGSFRFAMCQRVSLLGVLYSRYRRQGLESNDPVLQSPKRGEEIL